MKNNDEILKNNNINKYILTKVYKSIETPKIEVTDWSQMLLLLNIFSKKINHDIRGLKFNINNNIVFHISINRAPLSEFSFVIFIFSILNIIKNLLLNKIYNLYICLNFFLFVLFVT